MASVHRHVDRAATLRAVSELYRFDELMICIREAIEACLEAGKTSDTDVEFVGVQTRVE